MSFFSTGSLVGWKKGSFEGDHYGVIVGFEKKSLGKLRPSGAWLHLPSQPDLVWTPLTSLENLVQTGSYL